MWLWHSPDNLFSPGSLESHWLLNLTLTVPADVKCLVPSLWNLKTEKISFSEYQPIKLHDFDILLIPIFCKISRISVVVKSDTVCQHKYGNTCRKTFTAAYWCRNDKETIYKWSVSDTWHSKWKMNKPIVSWSVWSADKISYVQL